MTTTDPRRAVDRIGCSKPCPTDTCVPCWQLFRLKTSEKLLSEGVRRPVEVGSVEEADYGRRDVVWCLLQLGRDRKSFRDRVPRDSVS